MRKWSSVINSRKKADIGLLLEGTYPYVSGGVSSWVNQIILGFPELTFSLVFMGGSRENYDGEKYPLPDNVVHLERHYLMDSWQKGRVQPRPGDSKVFADNLIMHNALRKSGEPLPAAALKNVISTLGKKGLSHNDFLYSEEAWQQISYSYEHFCTDPSFVDYFWTVRTMHSPLFTLAQISNTMPKVKVLHAISTGYAGFLGVLLKHKRELPFILSEHGIYTKERKIDLAQADWIEDVHETFSGNLDEDVSYMRRLWIRFFEGIGRVIYDAADTIIALYEGNRQRQIADGAPPERTSSIPNGINIERYAAVREKREPGFRPVLGLIGRVVPIKDIKTFIRAMRGVCASIPEAEGWIVGPEDEDPDYVRECRDLVKSLGLEDNVRFLGFQKVDDILPQLGLLVLTSISEALPLVILEGYAAGVPALATDVGSCRELIEGSNDEDRALGVSGAVVPIADPEKTAQAAIKLLSNKPAWQAAQIAGIKRVEKYYQQRDMFARYQKIYRQALELSAGRED